MAVPPYRPLVEQHLLRTLGEPSGRASVTFLGTERIEVLRFSAGPNAAGPNAAGPVVRYLTLGMSELPMSDPSAPLGAAADPRGPRAELLLELRAPRDEVLRSLAVLAAAPEVEGLVVAPGAGLDLGGPLWPRAPFSSVLVAEPEAGADAGTDIPDCELPPPASPVRFLRLLPMTPAEAAWKRARGSAELQRHWRELGTDLLDPERRAVAPA